MWYILKVYIQVAYESDSSICIYHWHVWIHELLADFVGVRNLRLIQEGEGWVKYVGKILA